MIQSDLVYNPSKDLHKVVQSGWVDLARANALSSIPQNISNVDLNFNGIEDPRSIGLRPSDQFEAAAAARAISDYKPDVQKSE